ncbi:hypothetical protein [Thalassobacillus sp. CUG 92003]|uniref:hypothetical protein n=1 Tax=Thalassobacillus sp. CUG 92003 TaxID=2736641 RepID=UPI0015E79126|nr:hypothetical protein [Thalassobacillus sp. CUG 92003]
MHQSKYDRYNKISGFGSYISLKSKISVHQPRYRSTRHRYRSDLFIYRSSASHIGRHALYRSKIENFGPRADISVNPPSISVVCSHISVQRETYRSPLLISV